MEEGGVQRRGNARAPLINDAVPEEMLLYIFSFLGISDLCRSSAVCLHWHRIAQDPSLWSAFVKRDWSDAIASSSNQRARTETPSSQRSRSDKKESWKQTYAEKFIEATTKKKSALLSRFIEKQGNVGFRTCLLLCIPFVLALLVMLFVHLPDALTPEPPKTPDGESILVDTQGNPTTWSSGPHLSCGTSSSGNIIADILICVVFMIILYIVFPLLLSLLDFLFTLLGNVFFGWTKLDLDNHRTTAVLLGSLGLALVLMTVVAFYIAVGYIFYQRRKKFLFEQNKKRLIERLHKAPGEILRLKAE